MKSAMVTHVQQVHFNIFPFHCNECSVGFKRSKLYRLHMVNFLPQCLHVAFIFPSCISSMCCFNVVDHLNLAVHWLQEYGCPITLCTARMWFFKLWTFLYNFPHLKHFTDAFSKWDLFSCSIKWYMLLNVLLQILNRPI
jgi:hypothetical protein